MGVGLALAAALAYGVSDFVAGLLSRRVAAPAVAAFAQLFATAVVIVTATRVAAPALTGPALAWGALSGVGNAMGTVFLYRGFGVGRMSVVAPLSAVCTAGLPVLVGVSLGERPSPLAIGGIVAAIPAVWLVSKSGGPPSGKARAATSPSGEPPRSGGAGAGPGTRRPRFAEGATDGVLAGVGFALLFIALGQIPAGAGLWPLALGDVASIPVIAVLALISRAGLRMPARDLLGAGTVGFLGAAATVLYMFATREQLLAVAAVLTSLYPASTLLLAWLILRERVTAVQAVGLACAAAAVSLITLG